MPPKARRITSKAQWGFMFANHPAVAKRMADRTVGTRKQGTLKGKRVFGALPAKARGRKR